MSESIILILFVFFSYIYKFISHFIYSSESVVLLFQYYFTFLIVGILSLEPLFHSIDFSQTFVLVIQCENINHTSYHHRHHHFYYFILSCFCDVYMVSA